MEAQRTQLLRAKKSIQERSDAYFPANGYGDFHRLRRIAFYEVIPEYASPIVLWNVFVFVSSWRIEG